MGQYYKPMNLDRKEYLNSHEYDNGLKLMEHSYFGNNFVGEVIILLMNEWNGNRVIWAGDYADNAEKEYLSNLFIKIKPYNYSNYNLSEISKHYAFVNYDKNTYCKLDCCAKDNDGWQTSPIPLLLVNSNGRGGGDYRLDNEKTGAWACDRVGIVPLKKAQSTMTHDTSINFLMD